MTQQEKEIIEYWTKKINVELPAKREQYWEEKSHSQMSLLTCEHPKIIIREMKKEYNIPVDVYEILRQNQVELTGLWECNSGSEAYDEGRRFTLLDGSSPAYGTPIVGYYQVIGRSDDGDRLLCYYNSVDAKAFVSEIIPIKIYQLFAPNSNGNKGVINDGDILHVESIELINNRYAITWKVVAAELG